MCSCFSFKVTEEELRYLFADPRLDGFRVERIDCVSPVEWIVIVHPDQGGRVVKLVDWGFISSHYRDPKQGPTPICIRAEIVDTSPMFRMSFKEGRSIISVRGSYE